MAIQIFDNECVESHPIYEKAGALLSDVCKRDYKDNFLTSESNVWTWILMRL